MSFNALKKDGWSYSTGYSRHMGGYDARCWRELNMTNGVMKPIRVDGELKWREVHICGGATQEEANEALFTRLRALGILKE